MPTPRKTDGMHKLTGTKSQATAVETQLPPGRPKYPKEISVEARAVFKRLCRLLEERRVLTEGDSELLRLYSILFDRHARALGKIQEQGEIVVYSRLDSNGKEVQMEKANLWLKVAEAAEKNMVAILDRLGLTPMNRAKVKPTLPEPKAAAPEPLEEVLKRTQTRKSTWVMPTSTEEKYDTGFDVGS